jgi:hypothetical protein
MTYDEFFANINTLEIAGEIITSIPDSREIKQTFLYILDSAREDVEVWEILRERLAGYLFKQSQYDIY